MGPNDRGGLRPPQEAVLFRLLVENVRDFAIFSLDLDGKVATWNPGAEAVFGWAEGEILGQDGAVLFTPEDRAAGVPAREQATAREKGRAEDERWHVRKDGNRFFASGVMTPIRDGRLHGYAKVCRDVTERVQAGEALRASEDRHRFLADLAAAVHPLTDPDEIMAATARLLGEHLCADRCAYAEVEDESVYVITGDHTRGVKSIVGRWPVAAFGDEHHRMMRANEPYVVHDADADPRIGPEHLPAYRATDIRAVICLPLHKAGRLTAAMAVHQKVPRRWTDDEVALVRVVVGRCWEALERARVARTLREREERYRTLFTSIDEGYCVVDVLFDGDGPPNDYRFLEVNPAFERHTGLRDAAGRTMRELAPGHEAHWFETYGRVAETGEPVRFENEARALGGRWYDVYAFRLGGPGSRKVAILFTDVTARKRAEAALRASEERLRRMVNIDVVGVFVWALPDGRLVGANDYFLRMFGYTRAEVEARALTWRDLTPPEYVAASEAQLEGFAATGRIEPYEKEYYRKDRSRAWMVFAGAALGDGTVVEYCIDVSDRKRAEERVRESEERLKLALSAARMGIWTLDVASGTHTRDGNLNRLLGLEAVETEQPFEEFLGHVHPGDRGAVRAAFDASARDGRNLSTEFRVVWTDGTVRWLRDQGDVLRAGAGPGPRMTGACVDVTDRRRAEEALRESEGRHRKLADNLPAGFIYQIVQAPDGSRRFTYVSAGVEAVCGVTPAEVLADPAALYGRIAEDDRARVRAAEDAADHRADGQFDCEFRFRGRLDGVRWLHCRSAPRDLGGGGSVWDGLAIDVTDRKAAEAALAEAARRKDEFMAMLAHELRNPLAPLRNALQILALRGGDSGVADQVRGMMERQVGHLGRLVDDLLDVSRITTGKVQLRRERLDLVRLARQEVSDHGSAYEAKGVSLIASGPDAPVWVSGDPVRLAQVLDNLLTNALKFTARDGEVSVSVAADAGGRTSLSVRDTGTGIEPEMLARLFEPFSQADRTLDRSAGGLGLGLAIVKGLAELHGGSVRAESKGLGQGSTFTVTLPACAEPPPLASQPATPRRAAKRLRILVVEDNKDAADSLKMLLEAYGYEVAVAYSGPDGVRAAEEHRPEVVICDIGLPGMDGYRVAQALRGNPTTSAARLIALTGYGRDEDRRRAQDAGFDAHLTKPADPAALEVILSAAG